jgi:hypothetical protein
MWQVIVRVVLTVAGWEFGKFIYRVIKHFLSERKGRKQTLREPDFLGVKR